jgi:hypothetical protein
VTKAICDWGDGEKLVEKPERQQLAASNAAGFVIGALSDGWPPPEEPE